MRGITEKLGRIIDKRMPEVAKTDRVRCREGWDRDTARKAQTGRIWWQVKQEIGGEHGTRGSESTVGASSRAQNGQRRVEYALHSQTNEDSATHIMPSKLMYFVCAWLGLHSPSRTRKTSPESIDRHDSSRPLLGGFRLEDWHTHSIHRQMKTVQHILCHPGRCMSYALGSDCIHRPELAR